MERHGWRIVFHPELVRQLRKLKEARERARRKDPHGFASNTNVKLLRALNRAMTEAIPQDPSRPEYGARIDSAHKESEHRHDPKRYRMQPKERFLTPEEMARLNAVLARDEFWCPHIVAIVRLLMLTGCRVGAIVSLE